MACVAFFDVEKWEEEYLSKRLSAHKLEFHEESLNLKNAHLAKECDAASIFIYSAINEGLLKKLPKLKIVATRSTGFDHINLSACRKKRVTVCNVPVYGENTVAEHSFALILNLSRKIHKAYERTVRGDFSLEGLMGFDLKGKTIGVVGVGNIGRHVIRIAKGFEMSVLGFDVKKPPGLGKKLGFKYVGLNELLSKSDVVSLHVPYNKATHHLINESNIGLMKRGAVLINTSRGAVVSTDAIIIALQNGILSGAGLDVLEEENLIKEEAQLLSKQFPLSSLQTVVKNHILLKNENVIITPHIAWYSKEARQRILETTAANLNAFFKKKPINVVE
ncbi:hydroxyacid dehydrogenase [Candidatus Micrarchaeota archaeon]|nr:hydroxyacid dehydrogenase [Candidatus Micrarchaeota archaeon]